MHASGLDNIQIHIISTSLVSVNFNVCGWNLKIGPLDIITFWMLGNCNTMFGSWEGEEDRIRQGR